MSNLAKVQKKKIKEPAKILIYGDNGVGKTSLAAGCPDPIWNDIEGSSGRLAVARYPYREDVRGHVPESYEEVCSGLDDLIKSPHDYRTLVIDTVDALEKLIHAYVVKRDGVKPNKDEKAPGIHSYGFHKGFDVALDEWRVFASKLEAARQRGMQIVLLSHMKIEKYESPVAAAYDKFTLAMDKKAAGFLRGWCDIVGFACYEETTTDLIGDKTKGVATGRRLLKFKREATHEAKSRYALPPQIEMSLSDSWAPFAKALEDSDEPQNIIMAIEVECARVNDELTTQKARTLINKNHTDTAMLNQILETMKGK